MHFVAFLVLIATATTSQALQLAFPNLSADQQASLKDDFLKDKAFLFPNDDSMTAQELVDKLNGQLQSCAALQKVNDLKELLRKIGTPAIPASCDPTALRTRVGYYYLLSQWFPQVLETSDPNGYESSASGELKTTLDTAFFGGFQGFSDAILSARNKLGGAEGAVWLCVDIKGPGMAITAIAGLDNPLMEAVVKQSCEPIFTLWIFAQEAPHTSLDLSFVDWKVVSDRYAAAIAPKPEAVKPETVKPKAVRSVPVGNQCGGTKGDGCQLSGGKRKCTDAPWDGFQCSTGLNCFRGHEEYWQCRPIGSNWGRKLAL